MARKDIKLPSISRIINERDFVFLFIGTIFIIFATVIIGIDSYKAYVKNKALITQKNDLMVQKTFWEDNLSKYPDYRDGYLILAKIDFELGDKDNARFNLNKAIKIDPNYKLAKDFENILSRN